MKTELIRDLFEPNIKFSIMEDVNGEVDGVHILAKIKGEFFFPDGTSRNKRFYPRKAWENVIANKDVQSRLERRLMYGTIGHDQELNDKAVREGLISHFMTKVYIDDSGKGIGEAFIMNTPVGQILNTTLRAGSQLCVSSRADGRFKGTQGGMPAIDPDNFLLIGWDFVMDPGFLKANPIIAEAFNKTVIETIKSGDKNMEKDSMQKLVEHITGENHDLKAKNGDLTTESTKLRETNSVLEDENKHLKGEIEVADAAKKEAAEYKEIGTPAEIKEALALGEKAAAALKAYEALGSPVEIKKAFESTAAHMKGLHEKFGTTREIAQVFRTAEKTNEELMKIGTLPEIKKIVENFGTMLKEAEEVKAETEKEVAQKAAEDLSKECGAPVEDVLELLKTKTVPEVKAIYKKAEESFMKKHGISEAVKPPAAPVKPSPFTKITEGKTVVVPANMAEINESSILSRHYAAPAESEVIGKSRIDRMNEHFSK